MAEANSGLRRCLSDQASPHAGSRSGREDALRLRLTRDRRGLYETTHGSIADSGETPPLQKTLWEPSLEAEDKNVLSALDAAIESGINVMLLVNDGVTLAQSGYLTRQQTRLEECFGWVDEKYAGKTTLVPGALGFVDIALISAMGWVRFRKRADLSKFPNMLAVEAAHAARKSVVSTRIE